VTKAGLLNGIDARMDNPLYDSEIDPSSGKPPGKPTTESLEIPKSVRSAATLTKFLALYAFFLSVPLSCVGSFVGPQTFATGVFHAVFGGLLLLARNGLLHQSRWASLFLIGLAIFGEVALMMATVQVSMAGEVVVGPMIWIGVLAVNFALIVWWLTTPSARSWFLKSARP
jgi:hypothetical protein